MEKLEEIMLRYGAFCGYMSMALSFNDERSAKIARETLDEIYELLPEDKFKAQYPKIYEAIQRYRNKWNNPERIPPMA